MDGLPMRKRYIDILWFFGRKCGLWPFSNLAQQIVVRSTLYATLITAVMTQIARVWDYRTMNALQTNLPYCIITLDIMGKFANYTLNSKKIKELIAGVTQDWAVKRTEKEVQILRTFAKRGILLVLIYGGNLILGSILFICLPAVPYLLDAIKPVNETRTRLLMYPASYHVDQNDYYWAILGHQTAVVIVLSGLYILCDGVWVFFVQHACGLFELAGFRLKNAIELSINSTSKEKLSEVEVYRKMIYCIQLHKRAIEFRDQIENTYTIAMLFHLIPQVIAMSMTLVQVVHMEPGMERFTVFEFGIVQLIHMFFHCVQGQFMESHADHVYKLCYEANWYNASPRTQVLFVLILRRCLAPTMLTAGGILPLNFETFTAIMKATMSYFTVFRGD